MKFYVFVNSINNKKFGKVVVEASYGEEEGLPFVRFELPTQEVKTCYIGKLYTLTIEEPDNG